MPKQPKENTLALLIDDLGERAKAEPLESLLPYGFDLRLANASKLAARQETYAVAIRQVVGIMSDILATSIIHERKPPLESLTWFMNGLSDATSAKVRKFAA